MNSDIEDSECMLAIKRTHCLLTGCVASAPAQQNPRQTPQCSSPALLETFENEVTTEGAERRGNDVFPQQLEGSAKGWATCGFYPQGKIPYLHTTTNFLSLKKKIVLVL